jgi:outer membrane protein assembly factor BamB
MKRVAGYSTIWFGAFVLQLACATDPSPPGGVPRVAWRTAGRGWNVTPATDGERVFFGSRDHEVVALDRATGAQRWRSRTPVATEYTEGFNIVIAGDIVAIADVQVYAFNRRTGDAAWSFGGADGDQPGLTSIASDDATIYTPSFLNRVYAIDAVTGTQRWMTQLPGDAMSGSFRPTIRDGAVFAGIKRFGNPTSGGLAALDAATGAVRWVKEFEPDYPGALYGCLGYSVFYGSTVIVASEDGRIYALDLATGAVKWIAPRVHATPPATGGMYADTRPLVVVGDVIVAASLSGVLVGIDAATGAERWRHGTGFVFPLGNVLGSNDGDAIVVQSGGDIVIVDAATGVERWRGDPAGYPTGATTGDAASSVIGAGDRLFVAGFTAFYALWPK